MANENSQKGTKGFTPKTDVGRHSSGPFNERANANLINMYLNGLAGARQEAGIAGNFVSDKLGMFADDLTRQYPDQVGEFFYEPPGRTPAQAAPVPATGTPRPPTDMLPSHYYPPVTVGNQPTGPAIAAAPTVGGKHDVAPYEEERNNYLQALLEAGGGYQNVTGTPQLDALELAGISRAGALAMAPNDIADAYSGALQLRQAANAVKQQEFANTMKQVETADQLDRSESQQMTDAQGRKTADLQQQNLSQQIETFMSKEDQIRLTKHLDGVNQLAKAVTTKGAEGTQQKVKYYLDGVKAWMRALPDEAKAEIGSMDMASLSEMLASGGGGAIRTNAMNTAIIPMLTFLADNGYSDMAVALAPEAVSSQNQGRDEVIDFNDYLGTAP